MTNALTDGRHGVMRIVLNDFMSLDTVVQAPGAQGEDPGRGFAHVSVLVCNYRRA
ncbi:hypothetical protein [Mycobacterium sp. 050134]|uniref:hypothetical protein n=1 Tax=Mycobacterium sp. 050134 TaxID=3096111 RepID=UPI002ED89FAE